MFPKSYGSSPSSQSGGAQKKKTADIKSSGVNQINTLSQGKEREPFPGTLANLSSSPSSTSS